MFFNHNFCKRISRASIGGSGGGSSGGLGVVVGALGRPEISATGIGSSFGDCFRVFLRGCQGENQDRQGHWKDFRPWHSFPLDGSHIVGRLGGTVEDTAHVAIAFHCFDDRRNLAMGVCKVWNRLLLRSVEIEQSTVRRPRHGSPSVLNNSLLHRVSLFQCSSCSCEHVGTLLLLMVPFRL